MAPSEAIGHDIILFPLECAADEGVNPTCPTPGIVFRLTTALEANVIVLSYHPFKLK